MAARASSYGSVNLDVAEDVPMRVETPKGGLHRLVAAVMVGALCVASLVALARSNGLVSQRVSSVVDSNRDRLTLAPVPGVMDEAAKVANITAFGLRWAIFGFTKERNEIIPTMQGRATDDWEKDFLTFKNALPEDDVAAAVYNFEYWDDESSRTSQTILISWRPQSLDPREEARAGYYLGALMIATDDYVEAHFPLHTMHENYFDFCTNVMDIPLDQCALDQRFHNCPFGFPDDPDADVSTLPADNPCRVPECQGAAFQDPDSAADGVIPQACCNYMIKEFCMDPENMANHGCHPTVMAAVTKLCEEPPIPEIPELLVTPEEEQLCLPDCLQPCTLFDDPNDTWKKCSDCPINGLPNDIDGDGPIGELVYECHSDALGFEKERCCGIAPECSAPDSQTDFMCASLEYYECEWIDHRDCPELKVAQVRAASPIGCCETTKKHEEKVDYGEASEFEDEIHEVDCGGEFTGEDDMKELHFLFHEAKTCMEIQTDYATAKEIYLAELRAAAEAEAEAEEGEAPAERRLSRAERRLSPLAAEERELYVDRYSDNRLPRRHHRRRR